MHLPHEVVHLGECLGRLVHDDVDAVVERLELAVGDQRRDLHDHVPAEVEAGHLEVEPDQPVVARAVVSFVVSFVGTGSG